MKMFYYCNIVSKFEKMTILQSEPLLKQGATKRSITKKVAHSHVYLVILLQSIQIEKWKKSFL